MTATIPHPVANRIAGQFPDTPAPSVPLPTTAEDRRTLWQDALAAASIFYMSRLRHRDPAVAAEAAHAIYDLEKTRLRHGRALAGTSESREDLLPPLGEYLGQDRDDVQEDTPDDTDPNAVDDEDCDDDGHEEFEECEPEVAAADEKTKLLAECRAIIRQVDQGTSVMKKSLSTEEQTDADLFRLTAEYRFILNCFRNASYRTRFVPLPEADADLLAREFFIRRRRIGETIGGIVDLKGVKLDSILSDVFRVLEK